QKNKVTSLEDYAIEVTQEVEKDFNNAMGQESLTRFDQPKKSKRHNKKPKKAVESTATALNTKKPVNKSANNNNNNKTAASSSGEKQPLDKKPKGPRKPIIIKKNEAKK
ncbi:MAG TPA: hypothetical protein VJ780_07305, partial [Flavobacterium sp.]|nr:hypothetical protein [Flavobacterium sp.]